MNSEINWIFRLFVSGKNPNNERAVALLKQICEQHLGGMCDIKVIDVLEDPFASMQEDIIATPTLVKKRPLPERRIIGHLLDKDKVLSGLNIS